MRNRAWILGSVVALAMAGLLLALPSASQAVTITSVDVIVGNTEYCSTNLACVANGAGTGGKIWNLGTGLVLNPSERAVLTQNQSTVVSATNPFAGPAGQNNFNFDTSDGRISGTTVATCTGANPCATQISVGINGGAPVVVFASASSVLANFNNDPGGPAHNEAFDWGAAIACGTGCEFFLGYADTAHSDACLDGAPTCIPASAGNPFWDGSGGSTASKFFLGSAVGTAATGCARAGTAPCLDAGALQFHGLAVNVPEPSALLLLGTGLVGLAAWGRSRQRNKA